MTKITPEHLTRRAIVFPSRGPTTWKAGTVNTLSWKGRQLGSSEACVIDDDLGRSGARSERPGFVKLLASHL